jgi:hypothetical protein
MEVSIISQDTTASRKSNIDRCFAAEAIELSRPLIENAMLDKKHGDSGFLHIVVMDPTRTAAQYAFEDAILHEHSFGDRAQWDADYAALARAKARESWIAGADNPRGAVCVDGIVVGASGAFERFDRAYSGVVAMCLRAIQDQAHAQDRPRQ